MNDASVSSLLSNAASFNIQRLCFFTVSMGLSTLIGNIPYREYSGPTRLKTPSTSQDGD